MMDDDVGSRVSRLEEAISSLRSGQTMMQWAGGLAMTLLIVFSAALLNRTFSVSDQLTVLSGQTGAVAAGMQAVQAGLGEVKTELREIRSDVNSVRISAERIAAVVGQGTERPQLPDRPSRTPP